jgi:hypothetical protein
MPNSVTVVFDADSLPFIAGVDAMSGAVTKQSEAVVAAKNRILDSFYQQIEAAQRAGASAEKMRAIQTRASNDIADVTEKNATRFVNSYDRMDARRARSAEAAKSLHVPEAEEHDVQDITNRMRASALLRGGGLRAGENFASQFESFNKIASVAFPAIGAAVITKDLFDMGDAAYTGFEKAVHGAEATKAAFDDLHDAAEVRIDDLRVENDKVQDQIDKISGHPNNGLATALDEVRKMADQVVGSLDSVEKKVQELFKQQNVGAFNSFFSGVEETEGLESGLGRGIEDVKKKIRQARTDLNDELVTNPENKKAATDTFNAHVDAIIGAQEDANNRVLSDNKRVQGAAEADNRRTHGIVGFFGGVPDFSHQNADIEGTNDALDDLRTELQLGTDGAALRENLGGIKQGKGKGDDEAARKAFEALKQQWASEDDFRRIHGTDSAQIEVDTWTQRMNAAKKGSQAFDYAQHELAGKTDELTRKQTEDQRKAAEDAKRAQEAQDRDQRAGWTAQIDTLGTAGLARAQAERSFWAGSMAEAEVGSTNYLEAQRGFNEATKKVAEEQAKALQATDKAAEQAVKMKAAGELATVELEQRTGQISKLDAAQQIANIHTAEYIALLADLKRALAAAQQHDGADSAEAINAQAALSKASADREVQVQTDAANASASAWAGALKNANALWVQDAKDGAKDIVALYSQGINGLNESLVALFSEKHASGSHDISKQFKSLGSGLAKSASMDALKAGEANLLGSFGHKAKPAGTASDPLHVIVTGGLGSAAGGGGFTDAAKSSASKFFGSTDPDDGSGTSFIGKTIGFAASLFGGGFAMGGDITTGKTYLVGENGPELFTPGAGGHITPNHELGGGDTHVHVDARGATDPAMVQVMVQRGIAQAMPHINRASNAYGKDQQRRSPGMKRS